MTYNKKREVWEGWTVENFIDELEFQLDMIQNGESWKKPIKTKSELVTWCKDNQPYYKQEIPEVIEYFCNKYQIKNDLPEYEQMAIPGVLKPSYNV